MPHNASKLHVLYEDNHLLCVVKPAGISSQSDQGNDFLRQCREYIKEKYNKPGNVFLGLVHRLDRDVSGVMVFARTSKAAARLSEQFRAHTVEKTYMAVIEGSLNAGSDWLMWQDTMAKDEQERKAVGAVVGQTARLQIREREHGVLRQGGAGSIVEVRLETGRYHQIRYQCSSRGHPIVGDVKYGAKSPWRGGGIALCAVTLSFDHPITKERMTLTVGNDPFERALER